MQRVLEGKIDCYQCQKTELIHDSKDYDHQGNQKRWNTKEENRFYKRKGQNGCEGASK